MRQTRGSGGASTGRHLSRLVDVIYLIMLFIAFAAEEGCDWDVIISFLT
jgi:hypothetical protein